MLEHRKKHGEAHLDYLQKHSDKILLAGGLRHSPEEAFVGGGWIVEAGNRDEVDGLVKNDPYFNHQHRRYNIKYWGIAHDVSGKFK